MSFKSLVVCTALLAVFTMAVRISADPDTWWHLGAGRWMVENRQLLMADPFSLTRAGQAWHAPPKWHSFGLRSVDEQELSNCCSAWLLQDVGCGKYIGCAVARLEGIG